MSSPNDGDLSGNGFILDAHEVYDEADQASMIQMANNKHALDKVKARLAPESHPDFDGGSCVDCSDAIPQARLDMGRVRCVPCQTAREARTRLFFGPAAD